MTTGEREALKDFIVTVAKTEADRVRKELGAAGKPVAWDPDVSRALEKIGRGDAAATAGAVEALLSATRELRKEVAELRSQAATPWKGVWSPTAEYERGNFATHGGQLWYCREGGTKEKPGTGDDWSMMTKAAR